MSRSNLKMSHHSDEPHEDVKDSAAAAAASETHEELPAKKLILPLASVFVSMFLVALDRTIISTAIPRITNEFNSLPDVGWYGSAYLLTCCAFQLLLGKVYTFYPVKTTFLSNVALFEIGSIICGAAPSSTAFIVGRAISGVGAAGIFAGAIICIVHTVPLHKRPQLQGLFGATFGAASIVGPLIGGAFTTKISWRWCFYINLPFAAVAMSVIFFTLRIPDKHTTQLPWTKKLAQLDAPGTAALIPAIVCLLLALQWGGQTYAWSNSRIIALLVLGCILFLTFIAVQVFLPKTATIPPRIFKQRSIISASWATICVGGSQYIYVYFLPIWFQSITGVSAISSGIHLLPLMLSMVLATIIGGTLTQKTGYYTPFAIVGSCIMSVGAGLLTTLQTTTPDSKWIGYQIIYGFGMGLAFQAPNLAAQAVLPKNDVPVGTSLMFFNQLLGASIIVSIGENVLDNQLVKRLADVPGFDKSLITSGGATSLLTSLPAAMRQTVLTAYNESLRQVFYIGLILSCLTVLGAATLEWKTIKKPAPAATKVDADVEAAAAVAQVENEKYVEVAGETRANRDEDRAANPAMGGSDHSSAAK